MGICKFKWKESFGMVAIMRSLFGLRRSCKIDGLIRDERGVTTVGMAVAIFISVALIFSGAQLYRVGSASSEIQEVADATALAAENEVAEFVTLVNVCDATVLSLTLMSGTLFGVGIVTACIPPLRALSTKLIDAANDSLKMRDEFHAKVISGLNRLQKLLPFFAAANAMNVARSNNEGAMNADYMGIAVLIPQEGIEFEAPGVDGLGDLGDNINEQIEDIRDTVAEAEEAASEANAAKEEAYKYDCGANPAYCMCERAASLSAIPESENPIYESPDAWTFDVALKRARAYYESRSKDPVQTAGSIESRADSVLRKHFYEYAQEELESAYVFDDGDRFQYSIPHLFRNTSELRQTKLYTESIYPITFNGALSAMHAWSGCPNAAGATAFGSVADLEHGTYEKCAKCEFSVSSFGKVAAATTSTQTGFEYHFAHFCDALESYAASREKLDPLNREVKDSVDPLLSKLAELLKNAASKRLHADPPGKYGAIAIVVNLSQNAADTGFESMFVDGGYVLGTRAAVSGATLLADETENGSSVITSIVSNLGSANGGALGFLDIAANCWTSLLKAYEDGQSALMDGVGGALDSFSQNTSSGLGKWAAGFLTDAMETIGLEPADIRSKMPVVLNTKHIASKDGGGFAVNFMSVKSRALSLSSGSTDAVSSAASAFIDNIEDAVSGGKLDIASIELPFEDGTKVIEWILPGSIGDSSKGAIEDVLASLKSGIEGIVPKRSWQ